MESNPKSTHSAQLSAPAAASLTTVTHALSALSVQGSGACAYNAKSPAVWKWESDDGSAFNDFLPDVSAALEHAFANGHHTFKVTEKFWLFDLRAMTQSNYKTQSRRQIKRVPAAGDVGAGSAAQPFVSSATSVTNSVASAASPHACSVHLPSASAAECDHLASDPAMLQASASSAAGQSMCAALDSHLVIGKLAAAAKGIPIDVVYGVYVRKGHSVEAANQLLTQINQLHDACDNKFSFIDIEAAMILSSDSYDAALALLMQRLPAASAEAASVLADAIADPAPSVERDEKAMCIICYGKPPTHAFIPCGHKYICGDCNGDKAVVDGLHGRCPLCATPFSTILHIFES
jgi:hypothetical protein